MEKSRRSEGIVVVDVAAEARESGFFEVGRLGIAKGAFRLSTAHILRGVSGTFVYFLFSQNECVYIGQTTQLQKRLQAHTRNKVFDCVYAVAIPKRLLLVVESHWIRTIDPRINRENQANKIESARENGKLGGRPAKRGEPTRIVAGKLPASVADALDAKAAEQGLNRSEALLVAVSLWIKR